MLHICVPAGPAPTTPATSGSLAAPNSTQAGGGMREGAGGQPQTQQQLSTPAPAAQDTAPAGSSSGGGGGSAPAPAPASSSAGALLAASTLATLVWGVCVAALAAGVTGMIV